MQSSNSYFCIMKTNNVLSYFKNFFLENKINTNEVTFLLAVSGGVDSIVLLELFKESRFNFSVATCNFNLRNKNSDKDLELVNKICLKNKIKFYSKSFNVSEFSKEKKISIQMAARNLRYKWFNKIIKNNKYHYLVTGHHNDDNIETILFNFIKTTGYKGIGGIPKLKNNIIRPLIDLSKNDLLIFAKKNNLVWREDESNAINKYSRNKIRNKIIPLLSEINPAIGKSIINSSKRLEKIESYIDYDLNIFKKRYVHIHIDHIEVDKKFIQEFNNYEIILYDLLETYGFNYDQISLFISCLNSNKNKKIIADKFNLVNDRNSFYIISNNFLSKINYVSKKVEDIRISGINISVNKYYKKKFEINTKRKNAQLDFDKISYPLILRNYRKGESFIPLGMKNKKKISSYLSDAKVSYIQRIKQCVIEDSNQSVIWLVGLQINEMFKVDSQTKTVLEFEII